MNVSREESLLSQLRRIIVTMRDSGRKPMRIYLTYGQLQALKTELMAQLKYDSLNASKMELFGVPLELTPPGSGLWVSCIAENGGKK
jgi:hypothetical protein